MSSTQQVAGRAASDRASLGAVYTPAALADWVTRKMQDLAPKPITKILDPACGDAALLLAARRSIPTLTWIGGLDVSKCAASSARLALGDHGQVKARDSLSVDPSHLDIDAVVMNPPWGADLSVSVPASRTSEYRLATGQFDSWDLFIEWSMRLPSGTIVAAILPDALLLPEHQATRRLMLAASQIRMVARLGEGWFPGVARGVVVVVYEVGRRSTGSAKTVRIDFAARRRIKQGASTLAAEAAAAERTVELASWTNDPSVRFQLPIHDSGLTMAQRIESHGGEWTDWFRVGRGVEIGASGSLYRCRKCGFHRGPTRSEVPVCAACNRATSWTPVQAIAERPLGDDWTPLIVGRDVVRHQVKASRWLNLGLKGIAYKRPEDYAPPKLLIRKTGLGLNAAVDYSGAYTNQVVFHYIAKPEAPSWALSYVEGVLCSSVLLAFHLQNSGETEWRSHPYVTPKTLSRLPVPVPDSPEGERQAMRIAEQTEALRSRSGTERARLEQELNVSIARLFGLRGVDAHWVDNVLQTTQKLRAFAHVAPIAPHVEVA